MIKIRHTPGPWLWRRGHGSLHTAGKPPYTYGASVLEPTYDYDSGTDIAVSDADARLIAAAPELLETLQMLDREIGSWECSGPDDQQTTVSALIAGVLAKAEGRS